MTSCVFLLVHDSIDAHVYCGCGDMEPSPVESWVEARDFWIGHREDRAYRNAVAGTALEGTERGDT